MSITQHVVDETQHAVTAFVLVFVIRRGIVFTKSYENHAVRDQTAHHAGTGTHTHEEDNGTK